MKFDNLSDYCKFLEKNFSNEIMIPTLPVIVRLDGENFSRWSSKLKKPFDEGLNNLMVDTLKYLVKETSAIVGYHQSDEITLILYSSDRNKQIYHDGKKQKILSKLTGKCVTYFNERRPYYLLNHNKPANFDCRIYQTPTLHDACVQLLWRENDCTKNSVSMLAQSLFSHKDLQDLNGNEMQDKMMLEKNVNWNDLPIKYKRGTYVKRIKTSRPFSVEELQNLSENHNAHKVPDMVIERSIIKEIEYPIFSKITNPVDVIFNDMDPILKIQ